MISTEIFCFDIASERATLAAMAKTVPLSHRLDPDLKEELQALADEDSRSLTNYIEVVLKEHVRAKKAARSNVVTLDREAKR